MTILAPYLECDRLAELVQEKYPEVNMEILSYSGANTTQYLQNMLAADDLPDICTILPTSWYGTIQTTELTGKDIKKLCEDGYDATGTGNTYPYVLVKDKEIEEDETYQVVICGANEDVALNDSGIVGMDAMKND